MEREREREKELKRKRNRETETERNGRKENIKGLPVIPEPP